MIDLRGWHEVSFASTLLLATHLADLTFGFPAITFAYHFDGSLSSVPMEQVELCAIRQWGAMLCSCEEPSQIIATNMQCDNGMQCCAHANRASEIMIATYRNYWTPTTCANSVIEVCTIL